jgi:enoyl-CoA hydratase/carnithine racemase
MPDRYFKLKDHVGVDAEGNLEPIHEIGLSANVPTIVGEGKDQEIVAVAKRVVVKPLPGTRIVKTDDPIVADTVLQSGMFDEVDPPDSEQPPKIDRRQLVARAKALGISAKGKSPALLKAVQAAETAAAEAAATPKPTPPDEGEQTNPDGDPPASTTPQEG